VEGSGPDLGQVTVPVLFWRDWGETWETSVRVCNFRAKIWISDLANTKQESLHPTTTTYISS